MQITLFYCFKLRGVVIENRPRYIQLLPKQRATDPTFQNQGE